MYPQKNNKQILAVLPINKTIIETSTDSFKSQFHPHFSLCINYTPRFIVQIQKLEEHDILFHVRVHVTCN